MKISIYIKNYLALPILIILATMQNATAQENQNNQNQPQQPQIQTLKEHGDWKVQCPDKTQTQQQNDPCWITQTAIHEERKGVGVEVYIAHDVQTSQEDQNSQGLNFIRLHVPLGIYLPPGIPMTIDGDAIGALPIIRCIPLIEKINCIAFGEVGNEMVDRLKKGSKAYFTLYEGPNLTVPITVSLKGFTAAYNDLIEIK